MKKLAIIVACLCYSISALGMGNADPLVTKLMLDKLEVNNDNNIRWDAAAFIGRDLHKLWIKAEGEALKKDVESSEVRILYGTAISPYWDFMVGVRHSSQPKPTSDWVELGVQGLAPYFIDSSISLFVDDDIHTSLRVQLEKEFMLTQKWSLGSELEVNINGYNDNDERVEAGIDTLEIGLRLHYQIVREFTPYIGVNWEKLYPEKTGEESQLVIGFMAWL